jgi:hypothetical protein
LTRQESIMTQINLTAIEIRQGTAPGSADPAAAAQAAYREAT